MGTSKKPSFITFVSHPFSPSSRAFPPSLHSLLHFLTVSCLDVTDSAVHFLGRRVTLTAPGLSSEIKLTDTMAPRWKAYRRGDSRGGGGDSMVAQKQMNSKHDKRAGSYLPSELPCLGKQALALARRETCQGLICVFMHRCAIKHTRTLSHDHQKRAIVTQ